MKRSKLLISSLAGLSLIPACFAFTACGNSATEVEKVVEAIYIPTQSEIKDHPKHTNNFTETLKTFENEQDRLNELYYDLFGFFNLNGYFELKDSESFTSLYKQDIVSFKTNITHKSLGFNEDKTKLKCNFLGYCSFVFLKDHEPYKADDYIMLTYDIDDVDVQINNANCSLQYKPNSDKYSQEACVGFIKARKNAKETLYYIKDVNTTTYKDAGLPANSKNYVNP